MSHSNLEVVEAKEETVKCCDCNKGLFHYKCHVPNAPIEHKITATCPFCNGKSFEHVIKGDICVGPISKEESNYPTILEDQDTEAQNKDGWVYFKSLFKVRKG